MATTLRSVRNLAEIGILLVCFLVCSFASLCLGMICSACIYAGVDAVGLVSPEFAVFGLVHAAGFGWAAGALWERLERRRRC